MNVMLKKRKEPGKILSWFALFFTSSLVFSGAAFSSPSSALSASHSFFLNLSFSRSASLLENLNEKYHQSQKKHKKIPINQASCSLKNPEACPSTEETLSTLNQLQSELQKKEARISRLKTKDRSILDLMERASNHGIESLVKDSHENIKEPKEILKPEEDEGPFAAIDPALEDSAISENPQAEDSPGGTYDFYWNQSFLPKEQIPQQRFQVQEAFTQSSLSRGIEEQTQIHIQSSSNDVSSDAPWSLNGWVEIRSPHAIPTWAWVGEQDSSVLIPLLTQDVLNTMVTLSSQVDGTDAHLKSTELRDKGLLFGQVDSRDQVQLSIENQEEDPKIFYFRKNLQPIHPARIASLPKPETLYFVVPHVVGGGHFTFVENRSDGIEKEGLHVGVGTPILPGKATFLDLTQWKSYQVEGSLKSLSQPEKNHFRNFFIQETGRTKASLSIQKTGQFKLEVQGIGSYPLSIEVLRKTRDPEDFTHRTSRTFRYQILQTKTASLQLFTLDAKELNSWNLDSSQPLIYHHFEKQVQLSPDPLYVEEQDLIPRGAGGETYPIQEIYTVSLRNEEDPTLLMDSKNAPLQIGSEQESIAILSSEQTLTRSVLRRGDGQETFTPWIQFNSPGVISMN